jgi:hypothetical protein
MREALPLTHDTIKLSHPPKDESTTVTPVAEEQGVLNEQVLIELAPHRPGGTIRVKLAYAGPSTPIAADDPWAE